jgi:hypothetical protein
VQSFQDFIITFEFSHLLHKVRVFAENNSASSGCSFLFLNRLGFGGVEGRLLGDSLSERFFLLLSGAVCGHGQLVLVIE